MKKNGQNKAVRFSFGLKNYRVKKVETIFGKCGELLIVIVSNFLVNNGRYFLNNLI